MRDALAQRQSLRELDGIRCRGEAHLRMLRAARVTIAGFGSLASRLALLLHACGAKVTGVATRAGRRWGVPVHTVAELPALLPRTDVLVGLMLATPATRSVVDAGALLAVPRHSLFVNLGRGDTVDERALVVAMREGRLAGAALNVFAAEPLPSNSPLWTLPNVIVSPHAAGGEPAGTWAWLRDNAERLLDERPLPNVLDRSRG